MFEPDNRRETKTKTNGGMFELEPHNRRKTWLF